MNNSARRAVLRDLRRAEHAGLWLDKFLDNQERKASGDAHAQDSDTPRHRLMAQAAKIALPPAYRNVRG